MAVLRRRPSDRQLLSQSWERYRRLLVAAVENVTLSSYGRNFPAVFWLYHSLDVARQLKETPRRVLRLDLEIGRRHGDTIRYRVLERFLDRVFSDAYDVVTRLAEDTEEMEEALFPRLLTRLKDNVLLLTEDHISHDLAELTGYFHGYLGIDARELRQRLAAVDAWHRERLDADSDLRAAVDHLVPADGPSEPSWDTPRRLLVRRGYVRYLALRQDYRAAQRSRGLFDAQQVEVWEGLLEKLKEFELVHALRRMIVPAKLEARDGGEPVLVHRGQAARLLGRRELVLSQATRPMDFLAPWVVDPQVSRFGLIYDITDFSEIVTLLAAPGLRRPGRVVPQDVPAATPHPPGGRGAPPAAGKVPRRRRLLLGPPGLRPARLGDPRAAHLPPGAGGGLPLRPRHAAGAQFQPVPVDPHRGGASRRGRALRVLRPRPDRAVAPDHRQGAARDRRRQDDADQPRLPGADRAALLLPAAPSRRRPGGEDRGDAALLRLHQPQRSPGQRGHRRHRAVHARPRRRALRSPPRPCRGGRPPLRGRRGAGPGSRGTAGRRPAQPRPRQPQGPGEDAGLRGGRRLRPGARTSSSR